MLTKYCLVDPKTQRILTAFADDPTDLTEQTDDEVLATVTIAWDLGEKIAFEGRYTFKFENPGDRYGPYHRLEMQTEECSTHEIIGHFESFLRGCGHYIEES